MPAARSSAPPISHTKMRTSGPAMRRTAAPVTTSNAPIQRTPSATARVTIGSRPWA